MTCAGNTQEEEVGRAEDRQEGGQRKTTRSWQNVDAANDAAEPEPPSRWCQSHEIEEIELMLPKGVDFISLIKGC